MVVCLPGAKIEAITERVKNIVGSGKGGSVLVHVGTNNVEREGTTAIVRKYRQLVRTLKQTRVEQVILSGILPVMGRRGHKYRNCRGMAIKMLVQKLCREEEVGFVDLWGSFVGRADMYMKDGLHLSGKKIVYLGATRQEPEKLRAAPHGKGEDYKGTVYYIGTNQTKTAEEEIMAYLEKNKVKVASSGLSGIENGEKGYIFLIVVASEAWNAVAQTAKNDNMKVIGR